MLKKLALPLVAFLALWLVTTVSFAQGPSGEGPGLGLPGGVPGQGLSREVTDLLAKGCWQQVTPEVYQRPVDNASYETVVFGADGLAWLLRVQEGQLQLLESYRTETFNPDLEDVIAGHIALMERNARLMVSQMQNTDLEVPLAPPGDLPALLGLDRVDKAGVSCDTTFGRDADAGPTATGPDAEANVSFSETCSYFFADVYCNAYAEGDTGPTFSFSGQTDDPPESSGSASCSAAASVSATSDCFSFGEAQITLMEEVTLEETGSITHYIVKQNFTCRPPSVTISGPTSVFVSAFGCANATWTSSVSGGSPPFTYQWKYDGASVGSGTSYTRTYCNSFPTPFDRLFFDTLTLDATDSEGVVGTDTHNVNVIYEGSGCSDPCFCLQQVSSDVSPLDKGFVCP